jgi:hypothetical protein
VTVPELFIAADRALLGVVNQIKDDQWDMKMPAWFQTGGAQKNLTLRQIINYHAYEDAWVPDMLAGKTVAEVGDKYAGDLLGANPKASFAVAVGEAVAAVEALDDLDRPMHFSYGDYPVREGLKHLIFFRGIRTLDIAKAIGADDTKYGDLVQGLWVVLRPEAEQWRALGVFGAEIEVPENAPLKDRLLGLTGRRP